MRNTIITMNGTMPLEARKAMIKRIEGIEKQYADNPDLVNDVTDVPCVVTGTTPFKIFVFTLTIVKATGTYTAVFIEEAANVETYPALNPELEPEP